MNIEIIEAREADMPVIENLIRFYIYDMSEHMGWDCPESGLFGGCDELPQYWGKTCDPEYTWPEGWCGYPYIVRVDSKLAGFSLVRETGENSYDIGQFFILRKFRDKGVGKYVARRVFDSFKGEWEVAQMPENTPARAFWTRIIAEYTGGNYEESVVPDPLFPGMELTAQHFRSRG